MKQMNKLLVILLALIVFSSYKTYSSYEIKHTVIYPLRGKWVVNVTGEDDGVLAEGMAHNTHDTVDDTTGKTWVKMGVTTNDWEVHDKVHCDVTPKSFGEDGITNLLHTDDGIDSAIIFNISGRVVVDGYTTQANIKVDTIGFVLTQSGKLMTVKGFRKTGWEGEDC